VSLADEENVQPLLSEQDVQTGERREVPEPDSEPDEPEPEPEPEPDPTEEAEE
jgi:hypothetical protein